MLETTHHLSTEEAHDIKQALLSAASRINPGFDFPTTATQLIAAFAVVDAATAPLLSDRRAT
jgi:hypothetical protein